MQRAARVGEDIREPVTPHELSAATVSVAQQYTTQRHEGGTERSVRGGLEVQAPEGFFLALPVAVVVAVWWLGGATLMSVCGVALYLLWLLLQALAGG